MQQSRHRADYRDTPSRAYDADAARARLAVRQARNGRQDAVRQSRRVPATGGGSNGPFAPRSGGGTPWATIAIAAAAVLLLVFILVNLASCIGGALGGQESDAGNEVAATESADASASGSASESSSSSSAAMQGVVSPWTESGYFSTGDSTLDNYVKQFCDEHSGSNAAFDENARNTNLVVSTQADYVERENNQSPWGPDWDVEYAKQFFEAGNSGNCYNSAAVTQFILQYFGYEDAEGQPCIVKLQSGNWGDHGLVFVTNKVDGKRCIVDDALGGDGWMLGIDDYDYDVRNIAQNATVKGNVDALDDDDNPTPIQPGELTE